MTRIRVLQPHQTSDEELDQITTELARYGGRGTTVDVDHVHEVIDTGDIMQYRFAVALSEFHGVAHAVAAERDGIDAIVVNCMRDPIVRAAREVVDIPVIGPTESAMSLASILGRSFGVIVFGARAAQVVEEQARIYGFVDQLAAVPVCDLSLEEAPRLPRAHVVSLIAASAQEAIESGADVVILGCTGMRDFVPDLREALAEGGHVGIPFIDPLEAAVRVAATTSELGLRHSRRPYPRSTQAYLAWRTAVDPHSAASAASAAIN